MTKIALFASGSGSNAENIINYFQNDPNFQFPIVISNRKTAFVHIRAKKLNIPSITFSKEDFRRGEKIAELLHQLDIEAIVLAGFLLKVPDLLIQNFPNKIINIHPALLPKFGGKGMYGDFVHQAVKDAKEIETGITIHYVNEEYDAGDIIFQAKCVVDATDDIESIAEKVHKLEYQYFPKVIEQLWG